MKTDGYTKTLLSIIATCLVILTIHTVGLFPEVHASEPVSKEAMNSRFLAVPINEDGSINVRLSGGEMEVDITDISTSDKLNINLEEISGNYIFGGRIPVEVEE